MTHKRTCHTSDVAVTAKPANETKLPFGPLLQRVSATFTRRIFFSIVFYRQRSPALLFFQFTKIETNFLSANSILEFSHSQDPQRTSDTFITDDRYVAQQKTKLAIAGLECRPNAAL
jgi:hypothetical protein